ncbi:MAG TPA: polysaccharide deacetylase family protein [Geminicoccus sp.]|jgi:peptidoglycan/xylan/chitin deacetylase (PgdA/CDA1 family)|uniref:polysaccharide deacetylase family protein n=1 Tax=Geminicoccus sp. TaxID=2024832 RepID=UPI002E353CD6|nr:polysaccharide deacetylase family protein [Geminicoccus sp.]HEX2526160.1 polysaccharide deacetylase family protein [Geminicoccus sp.]
MQMPKHVDRVSSWGDRLLPRRLIVTFHGLGVPDMPIPAEEAPYWVPAQALAETIALAAHADIHITFDDGYASDHDIAMPMLLQAGITGSFFVLAGRLDRPGSLARREVVELAAAGMTIGSHGFDHVNWTQTSDRQMQRELHDARTAIQDCLGAEVDTVSVPFGAFDARVLRLIREAGYRRVYTSSGTLACREGWLMPRHTVKQSTVVARDIPRWRSMRASMESGLRNLLRGRKYGFSTSTAGPVR